MVENISANLNITPGVAGSPSTPSVGSSPAPAGGTSFSDVLKNSIDEVNRLQQDASKAVEDLATGKSENVTGVMTAMAKSDLAFKTLLAIRSKLMDAYEEIKNIPI
jgi:flagellar hook-basal body complex protein FliE